MQRESLSKIQMKVFFFSFMCMVAAHSSRESWYMVSSTKIKSDLQIEVGFTSIILGVIDTVFLFLYAMGYYSSGVLADYFKPTTILACGMCIGMVSFWSVFFR